MAAETISLTAPTGYLGSEVLGSDGVRYAIVAGVCVVPAAVAQSLIAAGFVPTWALA